MASRPREGRPRGRLQGRLKGRGRLGRQVRCEAGAGLRGGVPVRGLGRRSSVSWRPLGDWLVASKGLRPLACWPMAVTGAAV